MRKYEVLDVVEINGEMFTIEKPREKRSGKFSPLFAGTLTATMPMTVFAADKDATFLRIWGSIMTGLDYAAALLFVFAGVAWMFGHRQKGIEYSIGISCGYVLARHGFDFVEFLKTI